MDEAGATTPLPTAGSQPAELSELEAIGSQMAYDAFVLPAKALEPEAIKECRADIPLAYYNVIKGVESVVGSAAVVVGKLPNVNLEDLTTLPRLAQGLAYAALQVTRELRAAPFGVLFDRAQHLRRKLGKAAEALAEANLFPAVDVEEARRHARLDVVEECVALAALFRNHEALAEGRSPVSKGDLLEVEQVTKKLRAMMGAPQGTEEGGAPPLVRALEMRDRLWTLLEQRHDVLWRCGAWLYGRAVDERVPPLPAWAPGVRRTQPAPAEQAASQLVPSRPSLSPPATAYGGYAGASSPMTPHGASRAMSELERKTKFLVRFGVIPPRR